MSRDEVLEALLEFEWALEKYSDAIFNTEIALLEIGAYE